MNSVKNLVVIAMLMGVSYGAFQVINAPDPMSAEADIEALDIQIGNSMTGDSMPPPMQNSEPFIAVKGVRENSPAPSTDAESSQFKLPDLSSQNQIPDVTKLDPPSLANNTQPNKPLEVPSLQPINAGGFQPPSASSSSNQQLPTTPMVADSAVGQFQPKPETELLPVKPKDNVGTGSKQFASPVLPFDQDESNVAQSQQPSDADKINSSFIPPSGGGNAAAPASFLDTGIENAPISRIEKPSQTPMAILGDPMSDSSDKPQTKMTVDPKTTIPKIAPDPVATEIQWDQITALVTQGQFKQALARLSTFHSAELPADQRMQMLHWLDSLAGKVIYSTEHHLQPHPYVVKNGETLESLAKLWKVPGQLIYNVNRSKIEDPNMLVAGTELKAIQGPFHAEVNLARNQLTLFLDGNYAGRFDVQLGQDGAIEHGNFDVVQKQLGGKEYKDALGQTIPAGNQNNPYGQYWIGLTENMCIHDANSAATTTDTRGCIRLSNKDAADVFGILSDASKVLIR